MVYSRIGAVYQGKSKTFKIGESIICSNQSDYCGIPGTILEISTDEDKDTDNETDDIVVCLFPTRKQIKEFIKNVNPDDPTYKPAFDYVIMAEDEIDSIHRQQGNNLTKHSDMPVKSKMRILVKLESREFLEGENGFDS